MVVACHPKCTAMFFLPARPVTKIIKMLLSFKALSDCNKTVVRNFYGFTTIVIPTEHPPHTVLQI